MKVLLKPLFEIITGNFILFGNMIYNYIVMSIVGLIAYAAAWRFVGLLYHTDIIEGHAVGSIIHWIIRLIVFIVVFFIFDLILWIIKFVTMVPWCKWLITLCSVLIVLTVFVFIRRRMLK